MYLTGGSGSRGASMLAGMFLVAFVGMIALSYDALNSSGPTMAANPQSQTAAAPAGAQATKDVQADVPTSGTNGQCQKTYESCTAAAKSDVLRERCETNWKNCVSAKCVTKDTKSIDSCLKDSDCESSCTEVATGQGGLITCCFGGPQHNNACHKKIDNKCVQGTASLPGGTTTGKPTLPGATPGDTPKVPGSGTLTGSDAISGAFDQKRLDNAEAALSNCQYSGACSDAAVQNLQKQIDVQSQLSNCAFSEGGCSDKVVQDLQTQNAELQKQYQTLADNKAVLTPDQVVKDDAVKTPPSTVDPPAPAKSTFSGPDPNKPYYLEQYDEKGTKLWCDQFGNCKNASTFTPGPTQGGPTPGPQPATPSPQPSPSNNTSSGGLGSGLESALSGLLQGLAKALSQPSAPPAAPAQACSTDSAIYAQQQQQYQQALQQYNYQLQQYNYQLQLNAAYGNTNVAPIPPTQPTPCTPSTQTQCSTQPQQPSASTCTTGSWQPIYSGNCVTNWQCSNLGAQLSCEPKTADVGMTLAISYSCAQGTASGSGFTASGQSGTATTTVETPPSGTNTATYSLTCTSGTQTAGAQCAIQVTQPSIVLAANPAEVASGETSQIGWITTGMKSCVISSPDDATFTANNSSNTSVNGTAQTPALSAASTEYVLDCVTLAGQQKSASAIVTVSGGTGGRTLSITSDAEGKTVNHGDTASITWQSSNQPSGAAVALWLVDVQSNSLTALIAGAQPVNGSYTWTLPATSSACIANAYNVCGADLVAGGEYAIEADIYTPDNAYVGDGPVPSSYISPAYGDYADTTSFTLGQ